MSEATKGSQDHPSNAAEPHPPAMPDHSTYQSPLSWRYGSAPMRALWSEEHKRRLMRTVWLALAKAQAEAGLVSDEQLAELEASREAIDIARAEEIERRTRHDVMAEILTWAEQAPLAGGVIHLGATSADITDNVDALRLRDSLLLLRVQLCAVIEALAQRVEETAEQVTLGWTHIQPAAPTTVGYRLAGALQDFLTDLDALDDMLRTLRGKGFKGAVGTAASYGALLEGTGTSPTQMEARAMASLGLRAAPVTTQVYPRKTDWRVLNVLAGIAGSASTFAFNMRLLQSPPFGEWSEGFASGQVGSSAMPWKRNPINAENVNSLARYVAAMPEVAWANEATSLLERTLDDSGNRRLVFPSAFLTTDEILERCRRLADRLQVEEAAVSATLTRFGPFAATERVLVAAAGAGGDRQELHETIRGHSLVAWRSIEAGRDNPLAELLAADEAITRFVAPDVVRRLVGDPGAFVGDAPARARAMAAQAREALAAPAPATADETNDSSSQPLAASPRA
jgi:adenylosuccinate lyase